MNASTALLLAVLVAAAPSCTSSAATLPVSDGVPEIPPTDPRFDRAVQVRYLGVSGFFIRRGDLRILTAPFFSNPSALRVIFTTIERDPVQIDRHLSPMRDALVDTEAILVAHSHYDHLMDISYIAEHYAPRAVVFGSRTTSHVLAPELAPDRRVAVNDVAARGEQPGEWHHLAGGRIRVMAVISEHAPHLMGIKFFTGRYTEDLSELPDRAGDWREGQTLTFLIDFMSEDGEEVEFRIHYQDSASNPPWGFPPSFPDARDGRRVDLAILCVPGFDQVERYPEGLIERMSPRSVVLCHWEDFFSPLPEDPADLRTVPGMDGEEFVERLSGVLPADSRFHMPRPGAWLTFEAPGGPHENGPDERRPAR